MRLASKQRGRQDFIFICLFKKKLIYPSENAVRELFVWFEPHRSFACAA